MARETGKTVGFGDTRKRSQPVGFRRARSTHVYVEAGIGCSRLDVQRLAGGLQRFGNVPCRRNGATQTRRQNGASVDRDHVVSARSREANLQNVAIASPSVQHGAAAAGAMSIDEVVDRSD